MSGDAFCPDGSRLAGVTLSLGHAHTPERS
jgi:hypothetical protein